VFFDALVIEYRYEPEGYDLDEAGWYLPDFHLPNLGVWIEIKPDISTRQGNTKTYRLFAREIGPIIRFVGLPSVAWNGTLYCQDACESGGGDYEIAAGFAYCHICKRFVISLSDNDRRFLNGERQLLTPEWKPFGLCCSNDMHRHKHTAGELRDLRKHAKQARFEHGQVGAPDNWA
jgi:hypothetical protein